MVRAAMIANGGKGSGLDLAALPRADDMGPAVALLASEEFGWCSGQVIFSGGSELTLIRPPRLLEAVRTDRVADFASVLRTLVPVIFRPAEATQGTSGGSNPRFGPIFDQPAPSARPTVNDLPLQPDLSTCVIVSDDAQVGTAIANSVAAWDMTLVGIGAWRPFCPSARTVPTGFAAIADLLEHAVSTTGRIDAIIVALVDHEALATSDRASSWRELLEAHSDTAPRVAARAGWMRAGARHAARSGRPLRIVHVTTATTLAGKTAAQSVAQMARCVNDTPFSVPIDAYSISLETTDRACCQPLGDLIARLTRADDARELRGSEFVVRDGWIGLRSHPAPGATVAFGGPSIPAWVNDALQEMVRR
jgi:hypothetical protein